jgi:hypothetical protein
MSAQEAPLSPQLRELLDKQAIYEVLIRYCRGVDRCDAEIVRSVYHEDAWDDHGYWRGNGHDFADFVTARLAAANVRTTHSVSGVLIEVDGDAAWSEAQVMTHLVRRDTSPTLTDVMGARYLDRFERRDGEWRIAERAVVLDWFHTQPWVDGDPPLPPHEFLRGERAPGDPLYQVMMGRSLRRSPPEVGA